MDWKQNSKFKDNDNLPYFRIKNTDDLLRNNFTFFKEWIFCNINLGGVLSIIVLGDT